MTKKNLYALNQLFLTKSMTNPTWNRKWCLAPFSFNIRQLRGIVQMSGIGWTGREVMDSGFCCCFCEWIMLPAAMILEDEISFSPTSILTGTFSLLVTLCPISRSTTCSCLCDWTAVGCWTTSFSKPVICHKNLF